MYNPNGSIVEPKDIINTLNQYVLSIAQCHFHRDQTLASKKI